MLKKSLVCIIGLSFLLVCLLPVMAAYWDLREEPVDNEGVLIFTNANDSYVSSNPEYHTQFTLDGKYKITKITTYHWNDGKGANPPVDISLRNEDFSHIGTWTAYHSGLGEVPNVYCSIYPNYTLAPATYKISDSQPSTWSYNEGSGYQGMVWIYGIPLTGDNGDGNYTTGFAGTWDSEWGVITLKVNGNEVTGSFTYKAGKIKGTLSDDGKTLTGYWYQAPSYKGYYDSGKFILTLSSDQQSFTGLWGNGEDDPKKSWNGSRQKK